MINYEETVFTIWHYTTRNHYEDLGYKFTRYRDKIKVKVKDLLLSSNVEVPVNCDYCGVNYKLVYCTANENVMQVCKDCNGLHLKITNGVSYKTIKETVEVLEFILITTEEEYNHLVQIEDLTNIRIIVVCPELHVFSTTFNNFKVGMKNQIGYRCAKCNGISPPNLTIIKEDFKKEKYELLSDTYVNSYTDLEYKCPYGNINNITWNEWNNGIRCPCKKCSGRNPKYSIEDIKAMLEPYGREVISNSYRANGNKAGRIKLNCPKHGEYENRLDHILKTIEGSMGCSKCGLEIRINKSKVTNYVSAPQLYINHILRGSKENIEQFVSSNRLDIIIPDKLLQNSKHKNVFIEYDGGGHFRSVFRKKKPSTYNEIVNNDNRKRQNYFNMGWRGIIIRSKNDKFPSDHVLKALIYEAITLLNDTDNTFVTLDFENEMLLCGIGPISLITNGSPEYTGTFRKKINLGPVNKVDKSLTNQLFDNWFGSSKKPQPIIS